MNSEDNRANERRKIKDAITRGMNQLEEKQASVGFNYGRYRVKAEYMKPGILFGESDGSEPGLPVSDLLNVIQGVTWGGEGTESIFNLSEEQARSLGIEKTVLREGIGGRDIRRWGVDWTKNFLLFPYIPKRAKWEPAFRIQRSGVAEPIGINDSLDLDRTIDDTERSIKGKRLSSEDEFQRILEHRIAIGLVRFANAASYLLKHHKNLSKRVFEQKPITDYNKSWYEYHRPRTPQLVETPRIVGPRLVKQARFALDKRGYLPRDSVVVLLPKEPHFSAFMEQLKSAIGKDVGIEDALLYVLGFLNSQHFDHVLESKRSKKRGGYPIISEDLLRQARIAIPSSGFGKKYSQLIGAARQLTEKGYDEKTQSIIDKLVGDLLSNSRKP